MALSQSGPAPYCARNCGVDPDGNDTRKMCGECQRGNFAKCLFPFRGGKTYRDHKRGAHAQHLRNKQEKAEQNRKRALGTTIKKRRK